MEDTLFWANSNRGNFSVSSAFLTVAGDRRGGEELSWVWNLKCIERVKIFTWLLAKGKLLTNKERRKRGMSDDATFPRCGDDEETLIHIFLQCDFA